MNEVKELYEASLQGDLNDTDLAKLYKLDSELYDYKNYRHNEIIEKILKTRNARSDIARLFHCPEEQVAYMNEKVDPVVKYLYTGLHIIDIETMEKLNDKLEEKLDFFSDKKSKVEEHDEVAKENTSSKNIFDIIKNKSVIPGYAKRPYRPEKKEITKDKAKSLVSKPAKYYILAGTILAVSLAPVIGGPDDVDKYIDQNRYIISNEKVRTDNNDGFYYLHNNIAKSIVNSDQDKDALIYVAYSEVKKDASRLNGHDDTQIDYNMNILLRDISLNSNNYNYDDFDSYLVANNFIDDNGVASKQVYDNKMHDYISEMLKNNDYTFDGGKTK